MSTFLISRRAALLGLGGVVSLGRASLALAAAPTEKRLVVVLLRGALDGLAAVAPYGDPDLAAQRGALAPVGPGQPEGLLDLGGFFGLHPALAGLHGMYQANEALLVHAIAGATRSRSHFEAQDNLEDGGPEHLAGPRLTSGWLNRVVTALAGRHAAGSEVAMAVGTALPLLLRGPASVGTWLPATAQHPAPSLYAQIAALHRADPLTGPAVAEGLRDRGFSDAVLAGTEAAKNRYAFAALAHSAGKLLADPKGPRIAALEIGGWDTHAGQAPRLAGALRALDGGLVGLKDGLGAAWGQTVVLVLTEFGRTVAINGTGGTDHGTATVAFALGGAVAGGKVRATWPGLARGQLLENRDLAPTADLRSLTKAVLAGHMGLSAAALAQVFPASGEVAAMAGVLRG